MGPRQTKSVERPNSQLKGDGHGLRVADIEEITQEFGRAFKGLPPKIILNENCLHACNLSHKIFLYELIWVGMDKSITPLICLKNSG